MVLVRGKITMAWFYLKRQRKGIEKKRKNEGERERERERKKRERERKRKREILRGFCQGQMVSLNGKDKSRNSF